MRVFVPATLSRLAELHRSRKLAVDVDIGYAVTPALRESYAEGDAEELEYVASSTASRASLTFLGAEPDAPRRRVVVAADVPDADPAAGHGPAGVRLREAIPLRAVAAIHADDDDAEPAIAAAVEALDAATRGDRDAQFLVDETDGVELLWYATQEIPDLLRG
ncbi:MAG: hypothetical protein ICV70_00190 [Jiangellaceae bacterium]|nr:hypothetical protein [Jiangellaceae bacterium]